jgi:hypothetical protein
MPGKPKPMKQELVEEAEGNVTMLSKVPDLKSDDDNKKKFNPRTGEETNKPGRGKGPRTIYRPKKMIQREKKILIKPERQMKTGGYHQNKKNSC